MATNVLRQSHSENSSPQGPDAFVFLLDDTTSLPSDLDSSTPTNVNRAPRKFPKRSEQRLEEHDIRMTELEKMVIMFHVYEYASSFPYCLIFKWPKVQRVYSYARYTDLWY